MYKELSRHISRSEESKKIMAALAGDEESVTDAYNPPLYGDVLDNIFSRLSILHLLPASSVNQSWREMIASTLRRPSPTRAKPWLFIHYQDHTFNLSKTATHAFDPHTRTWAQFPSLPIEHTSTPLRSSSPDLLYTIKTTRIEYVTSPVKSNWAQTCEGGMSTWRQNPVVMKVGASRLAVIGGAWEFEDDQLAVDVYDMDANKWVPCDSIPDAFRSSSSAMWLSAASTDNRTVCVMERSSGLTCQLDLDTGKWGPLTLFRPAEDIFWSEVVSVGISRLVLIGLTGHRVQVKGVIVWEIDYESKKCVQIGQMPVQMVGKLKGGGASVALSCLGGKDYIYICNELHMENVIGIELASEGGCKFEMIENPTVNDANRMASVVLSCAPVQMDDLRAGCRLRNKNLSFRET